ncbi:MAG: hypothetical protein RIQ99_779 [Pseudomonadota bacterium]|jgi:uncharacterized membrane protein YedE/YeeE
MAAALPDLLYALAGGGLIGLAAGLLRLATGQIAGISGIVREGLRGPERGWQLAFVAGMLIAGTFAAVRFGDRLSAGLERTSLPGLLVAGLLVGLGTGLGNGCTSGHGICGLARFSKRSAVAVATFMVAAMVTVYLRKLGGWL